MITMLHQDLRPNFLNVFEDFISAFVLVKQKEETLQKLKCGDDFVPGSCLIELELELNNQSTRESLEYKALGAETSIVIKNAKTASKCKLSSALL